MVGESKNEEHVLFSNLTFSFVSKYSSIFLNVISAMVVARFLNPTSWGYILIALAYINFTIFILKFLPPGLHNVLDYFIPKYLKLNKKTNVKFLYKYSIIIKLLFSLPIFFLFISIFYIIPLSSNVSFIEKSYLFLILSPMIVLEDLKFVFHSIYRSLNKYKNIAIITMLPFLIYIAGLIVGIFIISSISLEKVTYVAYIRLISVIIPLIIYFSLIIKDYHKIKIEKEEKIDLKNILLQMFKYGSFASITQYRGPTEKETKSLIISNFVSPNIITGYSVTYQFKVTTEDLSNAFLFPMINTFSRLKAGGKENPENFNRIKKIYNIIYKYNLIMILFIASGFYFISDFILFTLYGKPYLEYSFYLKILVLTATFTASNNIFYGYIRGTNRVKTLSYIFPIFVFMNLFSIIFGLVAFGVVGLLIGEFISQFLILIIQIILSNRLFKLNLNIKSLTLIYSLFFALIFFTYILNNLIFKDFFLILINSLNLSFFRYLNIIPVGFFFIVFGILILNIKIIKIEEVEIFEDLLLKIKDNPLLRKLMNLIKNIINKLTFIK